MTSLERQNDKMLSLIADQRRKIEKISSDSLFIDQNKIRMYESLIHYIENNYYTQDVYTPSVLKAATNCKTDEELYEIITFFSGGYSNLFNVKYCYYQDRDQLEIRENEFINFVENDIHPVDKNGMDIVDFDPINLSFYCVITDDK